MTTHHVVPSKRKLAPTKTAAAPKPSLQEFTKFIYAFTKAHNQGNVMQIIEMLQTRFHPKFERVSYRIELPSRKVVEETKLQSFGMQSYLKYLNELSKLVPDSVFYVGRPFTIANYKKKRNLYVVQCNYSYRGTFIILPNDAASSAAAAAMTGGSSSASTASAQQSTDANQSNQEQQHQPTGTNVLSFEAAIAKYKGEADAAFAAAVAAGAVGDMGLPPMPMPDASNAASSMPASGLPPLPISVPPQQQSNQEMGQPASAASSDDEDDHLFNDQEDVDFSVVFGRQRDELTNLEFICFDDFDFLDDDHFDELDLQTEAFNPLTSQLVATVESGLALAPSQPLSGSTDGPIIASPMFNSVGPQQQQHHQEGVSTENPQPVVPTLQSLTTSELQQCAFKLINHANPPVPPNPLGNNPQGIAAAGMGTATITTNTATTSATTTAPAASGSAPSSSSQIDPLPIPFNLSGKLSFYVNKTTNKIVRMEYVYSS